MVLSSDAASGIDPIKHVIVLMLENHSFDQMLGCFQSLFSELDGVDAENPRSNSGIDGKSFVQRESFDPVVDPDPMHELSHVEAQLADNNGGFVAEYQREYQDRGDLDAQKIMDYFALDALPALHAVGRNFAICDRWFSSVPGPTWTNRFFAYSGTSRGIVEMPESIGDTDLYLHFDQDTIFDRLNAGGIKWRVYFGDVPNSLVLRHQQHPSNAIHYRLMRSFFSNVTEDEEHFPEFCFIEPSYMKGEQNDDHPSHSTIRAQRLIANVYNALRANEQLWEKSLLVLLYDEHGGFYDHVVPPACVAPDEFVSQFSFTKFGVRVPAVLVSPWIRQQIVKTEFDHTSLLKYLIDKWELEPLTERVTNANSFDAVIEKTGGPRNDTPTSIPVPPLQMTMSAESIPLGAAEDSTPRELAEPENDLQRSLRVFSEHLATQTRRSKQAQPMMSTGLIAKGELAKRRVEAFLDQQAEEAQKVPVAR